MISTELGCKGHKVSGSQKILWGVTWFSERTVGGDQSWPTEYKGKEHKVDRQFTVNV